MKQRNQVRQHSLAKKAGGSRWSGLSQTFTSKGEKRDLSDDEEEAEEQWWESFCSQSTKKDKSSQPLSSSSQQKETQPEISSSDSLPQDDTKVSFYLKVGKYNKFKYMWFYHLETNMNYVNTNRINNFLYLCNIQNTEENFKKLKQVIEERDYHLQKDFTYDW